MKTKWKEWIVCQLTTETSVKPAISATISISFKIQMKNCPFFLTKIRSWRELNVLKDTDLIAGEWRNNWRLVKHDFPSQVSLWLMSLRQQTNSQRTCPYVRASSKKLRHAQKSVTWTNVLRLLFFYTVRILHLYKKHIYFITLRKRSIQVKSFRCCTEEFTWILFGIERWQSSNALVTIVLDLVKVFGITAIACF